MTSPADLAAQVLQHCQGIIGELPDAQQRWVINQLAIRRGQTRGAATGWSGHGIPAAANDPAPFGGESGCRAAASDSPRNPDSATVAAAWELP